MIALANTDQQVSDAVGLKQAIQAANAGGLGSVHVIRLVGANYSFTERFDPANTASLTALEIVSGIKVIVIGGNGQYPNTAAHSIIERQTGSPDFGLFRVSANTQLILYRVHIRNGRGGISGGVDNAGTLDIYDSRFTGHNTSGDGAAIRNTLGGAVNITRAEFSDNIAGAFGGAIANLNNSTPTNSLRINCATFDGNDAGHGGAIFNNPSINSVTTILNTNWYNNNANYGDGGAILNSNGQVTAQGNWWGAAGEPSRSLYTTNSISGTVNTSSPAAAAIDTNSDTLCPLPTNIIPPTLTPTPTPTPTPTLTPTPIPFTDLNFKDGGQQASYQAVMFWAVYLENIADANDSGSAADSDLPTLYSLAFRYTDFLFSSPFCLSGSNPPSDNAQEPIVLGDPINSPSSKWVYIKHCNKDHRYMFARSMLNGFLNYERRPGDLDIWGYAADYSVLTNVGNLLWTISPCASNNYGATYQIAYESGSQVPWLNEYLSCVATNSSVIRTGSAGLSAKRITRAFNSTILPQVRSAVMDFYDLNVADSTNGAYTNLDMSFNGGDSVLACVGGCYPNQNSTLKYVYFESQADKYFTYAKAIPDITPQDIRTAYDLFIQQAQTYNPNYSSVLQPVLRYDLHANGSVKGLIWSSRVYQRSAEMGHFPR